MALRSLVGQLGVGLIVAVSLVAFFAIALVLNVTLSPVGVSDQTIGWIAAGLFFAAFWGIGFKMLFSSS
jgi:hypothetical protein